MFDLAILAGGGDMPTALAPSKGEHLWVELLHSLANHGKWAYLVLMTIQAVGLCFCVNQVPDLDLVVIGGGSKDALTKKGVVGYIIIIHHHHHHHHHHRHHHHHKTVTTISPLQLGGT